jgi:hypothetical protein
VVFVLDDLDAIELVGEVAPRVPGADLGDALDEQRQHGDRDVSLDAPRSVVKDRPHA